MKSKTCDTKDQLISDRVQSVMGRYGLGGDYRAIDMILVVLGLILAGGRRLDHLNYLCEDPLVKRFCGLLRLLRERSVARWLKRFTHKSLKGLVELNSQIVCEAIEKEKLGRLTLDIDGSVITTGASVSWAFRGLIRTAVKIPLTIPSWLIWLRPDTF